MKMSTIETKTFQSTAVLSNVMHACILAIRKVPNAVPTKVDGVEYTNANLMDMLTAATIVKLEKQNAK